MYVIYWRPKANAVDMRQFESIEELAEWLKRQVEIEPVTVVGIYDKNTTIGEVERRYNHFVDYFVKK